MRRRIHIPEHVRRKQAEEYAKDAEANADRMAKLLGIVFCEHCEVELKPDVTHREGCPLQKDVG